MSYCVGDTAFFSGDNVESILGQDIAHGPQDVSLDEFGSFHSGIVQFVYLDGHTDSVRFGVDDKVFRALLAIGDDTLVDPAEL